MLAKIYLIISILTLIMLVLQNISATNRVKNKYGNKLSEFEGKKDIAGTIIAWVKIVIISFIPLYHILMLVVLVFLTSRITEKIDEIAKTTIEKANEENR